MKKRLFKRNGAVWIDGEMMCVEENPYMKLTARAILLDHLRDQRDYIARLTERANKIEAFLNKEVLPFYKIAP